MSNSLTSQQIRYLRGRAHDLKPLLQIGAKGVTDALLTELDGALNHHELVKIRVMDADRIQRDAMVASLVERAQAILVQRIGHTAILYRKNIEQPKIILPD